MSASELEELARPRHEGEADAVGRRERRQEPLGRLQDLAPAAPADASPVHEQQHQPAPRRVLVAAEVGGPGAPATPAARGRGPGTPPSRSGGASRPPRPGSPPAPGRGPADRPRPRRWRRPPPRRHRRRRPAAAPRPRRSAARALRHAPGSCAAAAATPPGVPPGRSRRASSPPPGRRAVALARPDRVLRSRHLDPDGCASFRRATDSAGA